MTQRKPPGMSFMSWIDQQITEAQERGAFDDLPGAGLPIPDRGEADAGEAWLHSYVRREGVPTEEMLPTPLRLRKEIERLTDAAPLLRTEQAVRELAGELNQRIIDWRRIPLGPPIFVPLVDEEELVGRWRESRPAATAPAPPAGPDADEIDKTGAIRRPWWRRLRRPREGSGP